MHPPPVYPAYGRPLGPAPGLRYVGFWLRFAAYLIDSVILDIPIVIVYAVAFASILPDLHCTLVYAADGHTVQSFQCANYQVLGRLLIPGVVALALPTLYFVILWGWLGQSVGQKLLGMRVVDLNTGSRISYSRALLRYVGVGIAWLPFGLGLMWAGWDPRKQGWHDKIASTLVVRPF